MDLIVFSHLRWNFVYQRPQHLLSRFSRDMRVFFVEEPVPGEAALDVEATECGVTVIRPRIPTGQPCEMEELQQALLERYWQSHSVREPIVWFYTPMALPLLRTVRPRAVIYDCMDELSAFSGADPLLPEREAELLRNADLVFTGGRSLYESKRRRHDRVYCFPSSVDHEHYRKARSSRIEPPDQRDIARPRLGFFGVIDERFDIGLVHGMAEACPGWSFVMVGPVVKIDGNALPKLPNIHYLGPKSYAALPDYIATWDVALIPFARNASTRFISPTKVLEYMAAGKPIVSTSIADVVRPYGERNLVRIADDPASAVHAARAAMTEDPRDRQRQFDEVLGNTSWDRTYQEMSALIAGLLESGTTPQRSFVSARPAPEMDSYAAVASAAAD